MSEAAGHQEKLEKLDVVEVNKADTDAGDNATLEEANDVESPLPSSSKYQRPLNKQRSGLLSATSKKFDLNGKGYLDTIEKAMRDMDTDNDGQLELHQIYKVLQEHNETQKRFFRVKRILVAVSVMTIVLALSNLAMAFVAVELSKDFRPNSQGQLVTTSKTNSQMVQTQAVGNTADMERIIADQRMLEGEDDICVAGSTRFGKMRHDTAWDMFDLGQRGCRLMLKYKQDGDTVYLTIPYRNVVLHSGETRQEIRFLQVDDVTAVSVPTYTFSCDYNLSSCVVCKHDVATQAKDEAVGST